MRPRRREYTLVPSAGQVPGRHLRSTAEEKTVGPQCEATPLRSKPGDVGCFGSGVASLKENVGVSTIHFQTLRIPQQPTAAQAPRSGCHRKGERVHWRRSSPVAHSSGHFPFFRSASKSRRAAKATRDSSDRIDAHGLTWVGPSLRTCEAGTKRWGGHPTDLEPRGSRLKLVVGRSAQDGEKKSELLRSATGTQVLIR